MQRAIRPTYMPDFSLADIADINVKATSIFGSNPDDLQLELAVESAQAIRRQQTARLNALQNPAVDQVTVHWPDTSNIVDEECTDDCEFNGPGAELGVKTYDVPFCREVKFSVTDEDLRQSQYTPEEYVARESLAAISRLDNWVNKVTLNSLKANAGINAFPSPYLYAAGVTTVPAAQYNAEMVAYVLRMAKLNRMGRPLFLENGELFVALTKAGFNAGNFPFADQDRALKNLNIVSDDFGFINAEITEDAFMVRPGAVALFHKTYNRTEYVGGKVQQNRYVVDSLSYGALGAGAGDLGAIQYDAFSTQECVPIPNSGGRSAIRTEFKYKARLGFGVSPSTDATHPAILALSKGV